MRSLFCLYCQENFNESSHCPLKLECEHTFCKSCVNELKFYLTICPLDKKKVNYHNPHANKKTLITLKNSCKVHLKLIIGYCKVHLCIMCENCLSHHTKCKKIKEEISKIDTLVTNEYKTLRSEALNLENQIQMFNEIDSVNTLNKYTETLIKTRDYLMKFQEISSNMAQNIKYLKEHNHLLESFATEANKNIKQHLVNIFVPDSFSLGLPNQGQPFDMDKFQEMMNMILGEDQEVHKEIDVVSNYLEYFYTYFIKCVRKNESNKQETYMANFWQVGSPAFKVNVIGLGNPIDPDGYLLLHNLELHMNGELIWSIKDLIIQRENSLLCYFLIIPFTIVMLNGNKLFLQIEMEGTPSYLFHRNKQDDFVKVTDVDDIEFSGNFPVLYIGFTDQIYKLSELKLNQN